LVIYPTHAMPVACYFAGGLVGTAILGQVFDRLGWPACVTGIGLALAAAALLAQGLKTPTEQAQVDNVLSTSPSASSLR
jgi:hypothetical protein